MGEEDDEFECKFKALTTDFHEHYALTRIIKEELKDMHATIKATSEHMKQTNANYKELSNWTNSYIDRSMPIKSHLWILLASLTILSSFAAAVQYINHLGH